MTNRGVVYIVDRVFKDLVLFSLRSFCQISEHENLPITVYVFDNIDLPIDHANTQLRYVNDVVGGVNLGSDPNRRHRLLQCLLFAGLSPYDLTLYLDADTLVHHDLSPVFDLVELNNLDLAAVSELNAPGIEPLRFFLGWPEFIDERKAFERVSELLEIDYPSQVQAPYYNAGVICGRSGRWATEWLRLVEKLDGLVDVNPCDSQLALQASIVRSRCFNQTLSPSWNFSFRTDLDSEGQRWDLSADQNRLVLTSQSGVMEPLRVHHAIGAIHWMPSVLSFGPNFRYLETINQLLHGR